ncbi:peptidoglycan DD-metalloendopeptidase family protein [Candidatus Latescibacterota bacterium]
MAWKRLTFLLIPHSQHKIKQIGIHRNVIYAVIVFLFVAIGVMIFYIIGFNKKMFYQNRTQDLIEKNQVLLKHVTLFDSSLTSISTKVAYIESLNTTIMEMSEISDIDLKLFDEIEKNGSSPGITMLPQRVRAIINLLDKESEDFEYNFNILYDHCMRNVDFLKRVPSIRPAYGTISREFGRSFDAFTKTEKNYPGVDIDEVEGTPVFSTANGVIERIDYSEELGNYIIIDHENGYKTRYSQLQNVPQMTEKIRLKKGDKAERGQQIGAIGRTGIDIAAISSHLMYTVYHHGIHVNPAEYFFATGLVSSLQEESPAVQTR